MLDQTVIPAVDSSGNPGIDEDDLALRLRALVQQERRAGTTVTIYDPDLDPQREYAARLLTLLGKVFKP
ncbi:hypothetical protein ACFOYU_19580 [Microvirga sp. GCM10011540]|uniref:hypothetical protein n=1 Tax=Microvirga sp. GCM10011540 TaxID=3317338 RepID=UPI003618FD5D